MHNTKADFEILKDMESFTEEMFNQIIAFQEKQHPAWNNDLPFDDRIKNLPLHYLVFSNADRNPATHGPTVAHYYPLRKEFTKIIHYAKQVADTPIICDLHARNGFIGSLLAREGGKDINVIGLPNVDGKPNQIEKFFDSTHYEFYCGDGAQLDYDVAFSSWMPSCKNITANILKKNPKLIVYIYTNHTDIITGERQTGTDESFTQLPEQYKLIDKWTINRPKDLFHDIWPDLTASLEEKRHVRIYALTPFHDIAPFKPASPSAPYDWEKDLQMATLALQAKQTLRDGGFPV
ncbi:MAG: hypothetical protein GXP19_09645 [Gammaproteobacteria bacterium]|nr:hypothetical protein [Gammaproteobacteria bacterium]